MKFRKVIESGIITAALAVSPSQQPFLQVLLRWIQQV